MAEGGGEPDCGGVAVGIVDSAAVDIAVAVCGRRRQWSAGLGRVVQCCVEAI